MMQYLGGNSGVFINWNLFHTLIAPIHIPTIRIMPDDSQQSDLSIKLFNDGDRSQLATEWDIAKPSKGETYRYRSKNGEMEVEQLMRTSGGDEFEHMCEKKIPANCWLDFVASEQEPMEVYDGGEVTVSCNAVGVSECSGDIKGNADQFSHLRSTRGDNPGSVGQA